MLGGGTGSGGRGILKPPPNRAGYRFVSLCSSIISWIGLYPIRKNSNSRMYFRKSPVSSFFFSLVICFRPSLSMLRLICPLDLSVSQVVVLVLVPRLRARQNGILEGLQRLLCM